LVPLCRSWYIPYVEYVRGSSSRQAENFASPSTHTVHASAPRGWDCLELIESVCCLSLVVTTLFYRVYRFLLYDCAQATGRKEHNLHKNVVITWRQQKITSGMATMGQTKHIRPFSFSYISADLINSISGNRIMHKPKEKSTISTRILSSRGGHTNLLHGDYQVDHDTVDTYGHFLSI
jgi:hypothetical protein